MRKLIFALILALALPAYAGNSIRTRTPGTGGGTGEPIPEGPMMCLDAVCNAGNDVYYDPAADCFYCCDPGVDPTCGDFTPCDPTVCDPGDALTWNDTSSCFDCVAFPDGPGSTMCPGEDCSVTGQALEYDAVNECWTCCLDPPGPCDIVPCDITACVEGTYTAWNDTDECWECVTFPPAGTRRFLYRDQSDTFLPHLWFVSGDTSVDGQLMYLSAGDNNLVATPLERGASLLLYSENYLSTDAGSAHLWGWEAPAHLGTFGSTGIDTRLTIKYGVDSTFVTNTAGVMLEFGGSGANATGIDLGAILNDDAATQGFRLPQNTAAGLVDITGATEGWVAWATDTNVLMCNDGTTWAPCASAAATTYWTPQTNGLTNNIADAVHISADGLDVAETIANTGFLDAAGDLFVAGQAGIEGNVYTDGDFIAGATTTMSDGSITWSPNLMVMNATTLDAGDSSTLIVSGGGVAENVTRGAYLEVQGNEFGGAGGNTYLYSGDTANAVAVVRASVATGSASLEVEDGATDNVLAVSGSGVSYTGNTGDNFWLPAAELGFGAATAASAVCLIDDGADRIFHDTDCDGTKDVGEEYIDQVGSGAPGFDAITTGSNTTATMTVGTGASLATTGSGTITASGVVANAVALGTDSTGNYVATIADSGASEVTVTGSGSETAAVTLAIAAGITRDTEWDTAAEINTATTDDDFVTLTGVQSLSTGTKTVTSKFDFGGGTLEVPNSTTLPATCTVGEIYMDTDATTGQRIYACESTNTWALQGDGGAGGGGTSVIRFDATALHAVETNFAPIDEEAGTNVEYLMTLYGPTTDTCRNGKFPVPPDADLTQSVTMRLWFTGDGTADASGLDVIWYVKISDVDDGESYDTAYATQTFTAETMTTTDDTTMHEITKTFTGTSEMAAGDFIFFAVCRDADNVSDTYDGSARLSYMTWEFPE